MLRPVVNWKLVFALSLFGLAMAIATVFVIPSNIEPVFWLVIFIVCAYLIARFAPARFFLHGLMVGIVNSVWVTAAHVIFFDAYVANHAREAAMMHNSPLPGRVMMAIVGPIVGIASGIILGIFAIVAAKLQRRPS